MLQHIIPHLCGHTFFCVWSYQLQQCLAWKQVQPHKINTIHMYRIVTMQYTYSYSQYSNKSKQTRYIKIAFEKGSRDCNKTKETSSQLKPVKSGYVAIMHQPVTVSSNMQSNACTKTFSSTSTRFNPNFGWCYHIYFISAKVGIKFCRSAREWFICTCIWLHI